MPILAWGIVPVWGPWPCQGNPTEFLHGKLLYTLERVRVGFACYWFNVLLERMDSFLLYSSQYYFEGKKLPQLPGDALRPSASEGDSSVDGALPSKSVSRSGAGTLGFSTSSSRSSPPVTFRGTGVDIRSG